MQTYTLRLGTGCCQLQSHGGVLSFSGWEFIIIIIINEFHRDASLTKTSGVARAEGGEFLAPSRWLRENTACEPEEPVKLQCHTGSQWSCLKKGITYMKCCNVLQNRDASIIGISRLVCWYRPTVVHTVGKYKFLFLLPKVNKHESGFRFQ